MNNLNYPMDNLNDTHHMVLMPPMNEEPPMLKTIGVFAYAGFTCFIFGIMAALHISGGWVEALFMAFTPALFTVIYFNDKWRKKWVYRSVPY